MPTLYVDPNTGNDSRTYAQVADNPGQPWRTIGRAAWGSTNYNAPNGGQAAQAGDLVSVAGGTYNEGGPTDSNNANVALNPANNGTAGNLITFRGVGTVNIRLNAGVRGAMIGANNRSYIVWQNFRIDDTFGGSLSDRGPVGFHAEAHHCQLINSEVIGHEGSYSNGYATFDGNYRLVSFEDANNNLVKNNLIHGAHFADGSPGGQNEGGILMYDSDDNIIEHNEIYDCGVGIWPKGAHTPEVQDRNIIRYNYVHDVYHGIRVLGAEDTLIYQNIIANAAMSEGTFEGSSGIYLGFGTATRAKFINNTVYNFYRNVAIQDNGTDLVDVELYNNLITHAMTFGIEVFPAASYSTINTTFVRNFYFGNPTHADGQGFAAISFATWQGTHGEDVNGVNGINPQYTNATGGNFHIANATALVTGRVVQSIGGTNGATIPVGAYITGSETIGIESGADTTPPAAPTGLVIV